MLVRSGVPYQLTGLQLVASQAIREPDVVSCEFVSDAEQTLFRMHNGFSSISDNEVIRR